MAASYLERRERKRILAHHARSRRVGADTSMFYEDWLLTLRDFYGLCAYCLRRPYAEMDHFIPVYQCGDTSVKNVIPACEECHKLKSSDKMMEVMPDDVDRVKAYLAQRKIHRDIDFLDLGQWYTEQETRDLVEAVYIGRTIQDLSSRGVMKSVFTSIGRLYWKEDVESFIEQESRCVLCSQCRRRGAFLYGLCHNCLHPITY